MTGVEWVLVTLLVAGAACIQGAAGFGMGLVVAPILTLIDRSFAPAPVILAVLPLTILVAVRDWAHLDRRGLGWAIAGRLPGTLAGATAVAALSHDALVVFLGVAVLIAVGVSLVTPTFQPSPGALVSAGFASGLMGTATSIGGPPIALVYQGSAGPTFRSTLATYFAVGATFSLLALAVAGQVGGHELRLGALLWPGMLLGFVLSRPLTRVLDRGHTRPVVLCVSALAAAALLAQELL